MTLGEGKKMTVEEYIDPEEGVMKQLDLGDLDITTEEINFDEVDDDLVKFQQDDIVKEALSKGVDLRSYSRQIEKDLKQAEIDCVELYINQSDDLAHLHSEINVCDSILERMQAMLSTFQSNLGNISTEIKTLQDQSMGMNFKLRNRKEAEAKLGSFIESVMVPPQLVTQICEGDINDEYIAALKTLNHKIWFLQEDRFDGTAAAEDVRPTIERLRLKAVFRLREHLLLRFAAFRKPKTNIQIKQNLMIKFKYFYNFICQHDKSGPGGGGAPVEGAPEGIAAEIRNTYVQTMGKIYGTHFKTYLANMKKLLADSEVTKTDVLGAVESSKQGGFFSSKKSKEQLQRTFCLGQRAQVLTDLDKDPIIYHLAAQNHRKFAFDHIFRSSQHLLMDTATAEYTFVVEFFDSRKTDDDVEEGKTDAASERESMKKETQPTSIPLPNSPSSAAASSSSSADAAEAEQKEADEGQGGDAAVRDRRDEQPHPHAKSMFLEIFGKTLQLFVEHIETHLQDCHDALGLLLMIRIVCLQNQLMQQRRVHCLDSLFDRINMLLWPRFKAVFDLNVQSVKDLTETASKQRVSHNQAHFVTARYAEYVGGILELNKPWEDAILQMSLQRLRGEYVKLLLASMQGIAERKNQVIYLVNNYLVVQRTLQSRNIAGSEVDAITALANEQISVFIEQELKDKFGDLLRFVSETEAALSSTAAAASPVNALNDAQVENILKGFNAAWRSNIDKMHGSAGLYFAQCRVPSDPDFDAGATVLKQMLIQLVLYYQRFQELLKKCYRSTQPAFIKDVMPISTLMYEIRKYVNK